MKNLKLGLPINLKISVYEFENGIIECLFPYQISFKNLYISKIEGNRI